MYLRKYQEESTNVSRVSVSLFAPGSPHFGQSVVIHSVAWSSGEQQTVQNVESQVQKGKRILWTRLLTLLGIFLDT
jgi:hypothetical protein